MQDPSSEDGGGPSDLDLVRQLGEGPRESREAAFRRLFERHRRRAFELAYRVLGETNLAADAVQEAFLSVYRKGGGFEARSQFTSWMHRVVLNHAIDLQRKEKRHRPTRSTGMLGARSKDAGGGFEPASVGSGPEDAAIGAERAELVRDAVRRLSPKLAEVVVLRYLEGRSYEEIGLVLELPPGTVKSRLNRAHTALEGILGGRP
jgi:RNA polymerase sigma-70 factor (ECF subfamily)